MKRMLLIITLATTTVAVQAQRDEQVRERRGCHSCQQREHRTCNSCNGHWHRPFSCHRCEK